MNILTLAEVNQFLPSGKLDISESDYDPDQNIDKYNLDQLENTAKGIVFSSLGQVYETSGWLDSASTPDLVRSIMSLLIGGWVYDRQFSEEVASGNSYGSRRVEEAYKLLGDLATVEIIIDEDFTTNTRDTPIYEETEPIFEMGRPF